VTKLQKGFLTAVGCELLLTAASLASEQSMVYGETVAGPLALAASEACDSDADGVCEGLNPCGAWTACREEYAYSRCEWECRQWTNFGDRQDCQVACMDYVENNCTMPYWCSSS
jgi:hypothetical protein